jgi:cytochrome c oxidase cbb3-type subunit 4
MDIRALQAYAYFFMTIFLVVLLYGYIVYLYRSEKKGVKDYEKLGRIAIDDELDSEPVNTSDSKPSEKKEQKK